jgi:hypothetical protein
LESRWSDITKESVRRATTRVGRQSPRGVDDIARAWTRDYFLILL